MQDGERPSAADNSSQGAALDVAIKQAELEKVRSEVRNLNRSLPGTPAFWTSVATIVFSTAGLIYTLRSGWLEAKQAELTARTQTLEAETKLLLAKQETVAAETARLEFKRAQASVDLDAIERRLAEAELRRDGLSNKLAELSYEALQKAITFSNMNLQIAGLLKENEALRPLNQQIQQLETRYQLALSTNAAMMNSLQEIGHAQQLYLKGLRIFAEGSDLKDAAKVGQGATILGMAVSRVYAALQQHGISITSETNGEK